MSSQEKSEIIEPLGENLKNAGTDKGKNYGRPAEII